MFGSGMIILDSTGRIRAHDRLARDMLELGEMPLPALDTWPETLGLDVQEGDPELPHERVLAGASHASLDIVLRKRPDAEPRRLRIEAAPLDGLAGDIAVWITDPVAESDGAAQGEDGWIESVIDAAPVMIWISDDRNRCTYFNLPWLRFTGRRLEQETGEGWMDGVHPDERDRCRRVCHAAFDAHRAFSMEHRLRRGDGQFRWVLTSGAPRFGTDGAFMGYVGTCFDVHARHESEVDLLQRRDALQGLIDARTEQLIESRERLRVADRLALAGSLAQGLGHDMSNILFPVRCRLDAIDPKEVPASLDGLVQAVASSVEYLQELALGLRMLARDPDASPGDDEVTELSVWWKRVCPLLISSLPESVELACDVAPGMQHLPIAPHRLTQAVLNLVANAGEVMPGGGTVTVRGTADGEMVRLAIVDDGPGMSEEVRRRAFDPFFTTKTRHRSTGLGLALVHSVVTNSGGTVELTTPRGGGTTVEMAWPAELLARQSASGAKGPRRALVTLDDSRTAAWMSGLLRAAGYEIDRLDGAPADDHALWVTDLCEGGLERCRRFLDGRPERVVIAIGDADDHWRRLPAIVVPHSADIATVKMAIDDAGAISGVGR